MAEGRPAAAGAGWTGPPLAGSAFWSSVALCRYAHYPGTARSTGWVPVGFRPADLAARPNIVDPFEVQLDPRLALEAEGIARIQLAQSMSVWFDSWTSGTLALKIDGKWLRAGQPQPTLIGLAHPWPVVRFGPVTLSAGTHSIHVRLAAPDGPQWVFGVLLVDDDGAPLYRCTYSVEGPVLEPGIPPSFGGDSNL